MLFTSFKSVQFISISSVSSATQGDGKGPPSGSVYFSCLLFLSQSALSHSSEIRGFLTDLDNFSKFLLRSLEIILKDFKTFKACIQSPSSATESCTIRSSVQQMPQNQSHSKDLCQTEELGCQISTIWPEYQTSLTSQTKRCE